jgi:hypothetical protein
VSRGAVLLVAVMRNHSGTPYSAEWPPTALLHKTQNSLTRRDLWTVWINACTNIRKVLKDWLTYPPSWGRGHLWEQTRP